MNNDEVILSIDHITKEFSGTPVLQGVSFDVHAGEVIGLVGENGAGKTTLMSILFGMPVIAETGGYGGTIRLQGKEVVFKTPFDALGAGVGMVHQEFSLIPGFSSGENIMLNRELEQESIISDLFGRRLTTLNRKAMHERAQSTLNQLGVSISAQTLISEMPVGHKQFTEIAREIDRDNVRLLVLDEPTAVLTESEAEVLLKSIKALAEKGIAVIFISHRLHEVMEICDRVVVLRDGVSIQDTETSKTNIQAIAAAMVGRKVEGQTAERTVRQFDETILDVKHLWVDMPGELVNDATFSVKRGEIFGIGGLAGQGKIGIPNGIMGLFRAGGEVIFKGKPLDISKTSKVLSEGLAFVSEDRRGVGLLLDESLDWNIAFTAMQAKHKYLKKYLGGLITVRDEKAMKALADEYIKMLQIKCTGSQQKARELSGGNQQKICLAKAFCLEPDLLFVAEPTRGIDVGAKALVLDAIRTLNKEKGVTVVMISSELEELRSVCDRIAVVFQGKVAHILQPSEDPAEFALYMAGVK
ncbi:sugar ABC transporter ATP-binding protein [Treponema sp. OMZ 857]|uniref:sugar ABC transporter ATP-binding protein n=1 Tax=Treponema sp. OMZ 857 TaxID=1643513 RepID=UPI0020A4731F|nr:sugar ABC transporter ATP-binding protein [Treponema sp. OMZ 857]UTC43317.1 sugar ABC transporter ATP-binding protein [Treponema sp. OMZ 857]